MVTKKNYLQLLGLFLLPITTHAHPGYEIIESGIILAASLFILLLFVTNLPVAKLLKRIKTRTDQDKYSESGKF